VVVSVTLQHHHRRVKEGTCRLGRFGIKLGVPGSQLSSPFYFNMNRSTKFNPSCGQLRELKRETNKGKNNSCLVPQHGCVEVFFEFFSLNCSARKQGYGRPTYPLDKRSLMFSIAIF
jgi:hypothetical protein